MGKLEALKQLKTAYLQQMFPQEAECVPRVWFVGFARSWEKKKLDEVVDIYDGTHQTPRYTDSGIMFLSVENIKTLHSEKFISEEDFDKDYKVSPNTEMF